MYYVYRFLDKAGNVIYVGKSKQDLEQRFRGHSHLPDACYDLVYRIEYIECSTESDMTIKEIYYINKFQNDQTFFNILDMRDVPVSVEFDDQWMQYVGPLNSRFHQSINYIEGYVKEKTVRYNKDGSYDRRKTNKVKGMDSYVEALTAEEVNAVVDYLIREINAAQNGNQEQIRFRNLVMFVLGVNLPHKSNDFLCFKYRDLFDENDCPKAVELNLGRFQKDEVIPIPLRNVAKCVLLAYVKKYGLNYAENANDNLFQSRKHQVVTGKSWWYILDNSAKAVGIEKSIGSESLRKTYGLNIYTVSKSKLGALLFLGELWGHIREAQVIRYLNLSDEEIDYDYYLGECFALGNVDLAKINCLNPSVPLTIPQIQSTTVQKSEQKVSGETKQETDAKQETKNSRPPKKKEPIHWYVETHRKVTPRSNIVRPKEVKLEIVNKNLVERVSQRVLAEEYGVPAGTISRWVNEYMKHGEAAFEDKRRKLK